RACLVPDIPSSLVEADAGDVAAARGRHPRAPGDILIGYVGSFAAYQGIELLFAAIPLVAAAEPRARFVVIGGSDREVADRRAQLAACGCLDAVDFAGFIDPDALPAHLAAFDILLSPRVSGMNTPLKLLDYLKAGGAIAATDTPANRLILDSRTAELSPPEPNAFAAAILRLCASPERRAALAEGGRRILDERHNYAFFKDGLRQCYEYVLLAR
ncbi:MAG: glycosyltransferase, partial [Kiritimatiellae bacterium]|nr:glycosyltransferase [Kiritimatiellia bacterium]